MKEIKNELPFNDQTKFIVDLEKNRNTSIAILIDSEIEKYISIQRMINSDLEKIKFSDLFEELKQNLPFSLHLNHNTPHNITIYYNDISSESGDLWRVYHKRFSDIELI